MNLYKGIRIFIAGVVMLILVSSCSKAGKIVGKWEVHEVVFECPAISDEDLGYTEELIRTFSYDFNADGTLIYKDAVIPETSGTWKLNDDQLDIDIDTKTPKYDGTRDHSILPQSYKLISVDSENLKLLERSKEDCDIIIYLREKG